MRPRRVHGQEVEHKGAFWMSCQPGSYFGGAVRADRVQDDVDRLTRWGLFVEYGQQFAELARAVLETDHATHLAVIDAKAGQQVHGAVADILELAPCWARLGRPLTWNGRLVGCGGFADPDARFFIDAEQRPVGRRASSNSITATALVGKSGSRSFIQVSKTVQANLVPLEDDANGAFAGMAQAQFGVGGQVLRQVVDAPVGLSSSAGINLRRLLASQDQKSGLDVSVVLAWRWTFGMVLQAIQPLLGETMAPQPDGADRQAQVLSDGAIGLAGSGTQDDLGTVGILLGGGAGSDTSLQFGALGRHQPNASTTRFGHASEGFRYYPSQPATLHMYSKCESINRKGY